LADFLDRVRDYVRQVFAQSEGWSVEEGSVEGAPVMVIRRRGQIAIARVVEKGLVTKELVQEVSALRDTNQAYLGIIYRAREVGVGPHESALATRLGVRIVEV